MAIYIQNLHVQSFRGIKDLEVERLNHINLIVGDNNCGKTSVLEALLLLRGPSDFSNVLRVARLRDQDNSLFTGRASAFENFYNLFLQPSKKPTIHLWAMRIKKFCLLGAQPHDAVVSCGCRFAVPAKFRGKINLPDKVIVYVNALGAMAAGFIRGVDNYLFHKLT